MFLWPEGYNRQPQNPLKELIQRTEGDILLLLEEDLFTKQTRLGDALAIDTLVKGTRGLLEVMFMDYEYVLEEHFQQLANQYSIMWELIDLKVEKVNSQILANWELVFDLFNNKLVNELQWFYALRIIQFVAQEQFSLLSKHQDKLQSFYGHLQYTHVAHIVIELMQCQFNSFQQSFICKGIEEFSEMNEITAINFTSVIHEIFTKIKSQELVNFIITSEILNNMFKVIQQENISQIVTKNAAHIIFLISNHYSSELQNLDLEEDESEAITQQFEESSFFKAITSNLPILNGILLHQMITSKKIGSVLIKIIEIMDNLIRITNVSLWENMNSAKIMKSIFQLTTIYPKSDILISQIERVVFYIFERALNDNHPFWAVQLIKNYAIQDFNNLMFNRQLYSFEQELNNKILKEMDYITYDQQILEINKELELSIIWKKSKWILRQQQLENQQKLGSQMQIKEEEEAGEVKILSVDDLAKLVECNLVNDEENKDEEKNDEEKKDEEKKDEEKKDDQDDNLLDGIDEPQINGQDHDKLSSSSSSSNSSSSSEKNDTTPQSNLSRSANLEQLSFQARRNNLNIQQIEKLRKKSIQFEKISQQLVSAGRRLSLQAGLNIKDISPTYLEFKLDFKNKVLRNINDNSILKVDELDINP